jgi:phage terminase large subunit
MGRQRLRQSHYMAGAVVEHCLSGSRIVCIREVQKTLAQSAKLLIENKIQEFGVGSQFRVLYDRIETPGRGLIIFQGIVDATAESIKSLEGYNIAWVEEAQTLSNRSLALLRPTQGAGAAAQRIESVRRLLPKCWFNEATTEAGRDALGYTASSNYVSSDSGSSLCRDHSKPRLWNGLVP